MLSLSLGLCAALAWGVHDICVRYVSQQGGILPALATVLGVGVLALLPAVVWSSGWDAMSLRAYQFSALSGLCYVVGCTGLYKGLGIGPVRLVAPIMGAYPILSIGWAALQGQAVPLGQWLAVVAVIIGVAVVGILSESSESGGSKREAIGWAILGAVGFAMTFALGHIATQSGAEVPVVFVTRIITFGCILIALLWSKGRSVPDRAAWPMLAMMGVLDAFALGIVVAAGGLPRPEFAAVAASTFGIITIILAWLFLRERMTGMQWLGVGITFAGIGYLAL